jgi:DNA-binding response OmpR family regulator
VFWQGGTMGLRVYIFDADLSTRTLLTFLLQSRGHQAQELAEPCNNALTYTENITCPSDSSCTDAIIVNTRLPVQESIQRLQHHNQTGCKIPKQNIVIMTTYATEEQRQTIREMGFSAIKKPFKLHEIDEWLDACAKRLKEP